MDRVGCSRASRRSRKVSLVCPLSTRILPIHGRVRPLVPHRHAPGRHLRHHPRQGHVRRPLRGRRHAHPRQRGLPSPRAPLGRGRRAPRRGPPLAQRHPRQRPRHRSLPPPHRRLPHHRLLDHPGRRPRLEQARRQLGPHHQHRHAPQGPQAPARSTLRQPRRTTIVRSIANARALPARPFIGPQQRRRVRPHLLPPRPPLLCRDRSPHRRPPAQGPLSNAQLARRHLQSRTRHSLALPRRIDRVSRRTALRGIPSIRRRQAARRRPLPARSPRHPQRRRPSRPRRPRTHDPRDRRRSPHDCSFDRRQPLYRSRSHAVARPPPRSRPVGNDRLIPLRSRLALQMKVLLVDPSRLYGDRWIAGELQHLFALYSWVRARCPDVTIDVLDLERELSAPATHDQVAEFLRLARAALSTFDFDLVGISCWSSLHYLASLEIARLCKELNPDCSIVVGGYHPSSLPADFTYEQSPFDWVVVGEGERALEQIIKGEILRTNKTQIVQGTPIELGAHPLCWDEYRYFKDADRVGIWLTRGCPFACGYCLDRLTRWRGYDPAAAIEELKRLKRQLPRVRQVNLLDPIFGVNQSWRREFLSRLREADLDLGYWGETRVDVLDEDDVRLLGELRFQMDL